ncbi:MAG: HDOD domain-containing protein, partial [Steroidobacteraceae bacterium]
VTPAASRATEATRIPGARGTADAGGAAAAGRGNETSRGAETGAAGRSREASGDASAAETLSQVEIFRRLYELAFGVERLGLPALEAYDAVAPGILAVLESVATEPRYAPRRPLLLPQLLRAMRDDEVSRTELARIIARDPALTGSLLKLANGAFYRVTGRPVESVDRAVALLGTDGIRSLVATALVQPVFRLSELEFPTFPETVWDLTLRVAAAAESHAAIVEDSDPFAAQLLGLTMGLGTIVVFRVALDRYAARAGAARGAVSRSQIGPSAAVIASILNAHAATVAGRIAASWDLSGRILAALADQVSGPEMREPTSLGRSLLFGRVMGALAVLRGADRITDETAKASILGIGATEFQFDRLWGRLTEQRPDERR